VADFLFELGIEEVPVSEIKSITGQLEDKFISKLDTQKITFNSLESAVTNRRFMVHISGLADKAQNHEAQILGPALNIAYDKKGNPTIALKKFIESQGINKSDLIEIETKKGTYTGTQKKTKGKLIHDVLTEIIPEVLRELIFSKTMVWNKSRIPFIRPIKNILSLLNSQLIECRFAGVKSSNFIHGHNLLSADPLEIHSVKDYIEKLNKNFVMVRDDERREKILNEIKDIEEELNARVEVDSESLDYYIYNNEYPVVFTGEFEKKYLSLPSEIISTFMRKEKKLQPIYDSKGNLMKIFLGVSNIPDENKNVVHGNENVIQATLEDAKFFWENDKKDDFISLREKLKNVIFQKDLGSFFDKTERLKDLTGFLAHITQNADLTDNLGQASLYCKNDLVARMVREFPSLQGIMGGLYLKENQYDEDIWRTIYSHYLPRGFSDEKLEHLGAGLLSLADKIDNITGFLHKGIKTSGSKDPYGIRRDANAIIKLMIDLKLDFDLNPLIQFAAENLLSHLKPEKIDDDAVTLTLKIKKLFNIRIENVFKDNLNMKPDLISAIMNEDTLFIYTMYQRAKAVLSMKETTSIEHLIILHKRLKNIIKDFEPYSVAEEHLVENEEKILFDIFNQSKTRVEELILDHQYIQAGSIILEMKPVIDNFFNRVLVMAKDEKLKKNRIALLQKIDELLSKIADFSSIVE
jgi:glycyl-tRNA synthetase beta chain